ncbi:MAG: DUF502 domain-containing protein, partial [Clostridia bacterium]|nr:DUF502 domain-containing protein [Clostridia bacterium]
MRRLRRFFLTGIIVTLPAAATIYLLWVVFNFLDRLVGNAINLLLGWRIPGLGLAVMLVIVLAAGVLTTNIVGRFFLNLWDNLMYRIPLVNSVYRTLKQMVETFWRDDKKAFKQVVMIEYPRRGIYSLGFLVGPVAAEINMRAARDMLAVFVPTTPNPTSGFLLMLPIEDVTLLDMQVEDALKYIVSAGVVGPGNEPEVYPKSGWKDAVKGFAGTRFNLSQRDRR